MGGVACIRGTRIPVSIVIGLLAEGLSADQTRLDHPQLTDEALELVLRRLPNRSSTAINRQVARTAIASTALTVSDRLKLPLSITFRG